MIIRKGRPEDAESALHLVRKFHAASIEDFGFGFNEQDALNLMRQIAAQHLAFVVEDDETGKLVGVIAGSVTEYYLNRIQFVFQEMIWYVDAEHRGIGKDLFEACLKHLKDIGVHKVIMCTMTNSMREILGRFYKQSGFQEMETHFVR